MKISFKSTLALFSSFLLMITISSCNTNNEKNRMQQVLDKSYFQKHLNDGNTTWEYQTTSITQTNDIIFADINVNKKAQEILRNQSKLSKYYKFLSSINITDHNLAFPLFTDEQYEEMERVSQANGYNLDELKQQYARNKELYEEIKLQSRSIKNDSTLYRIDCTLIIDRSGKKTKGDFAFWLSADKKKILKVENKNSSREKEMKNIIENAIIENY